MAGACWPLEGGDQLLDPVVARFEGVLAEAGALRLVVELEVDPVHGEISPSLLGPANELAPEFGPSGLGRLVHRNLDVLVPAGAFDQTSRLHLVEEAPFPADVVILQVDQGDLRM